MRVTRIVVLLALPALFAAALAFEREPAPPTAPTRAAVERWAPVVPAGDASSSTWFCAAGTARGAEGEAEQFVVVTNDGDAGLDATLTAYADDGEQATRTVPVAARSRAQVRVSDLVVADWAAVVVEAPAGRVGVDHVVSGPTGRSAGPCASSASSTWYLPAGTTVLGASHRLALFNPFAADAVVDIAFETETDRRTPPEYQGLVVPAGRVSVLDVSAVVTVREQLATQVVARSGLVVAEQLELVAADSELPTSSALTLGAPVSAGTWHLPAGPPLGGEVRSRVVVFNPAEEPAEVDVQVVLDDPDAHPFVEPFELTVRPGQYAEVDLGADGRVPEGVGWSAFATSRNDVAVVAGSVVEAGGEADPRGRSVVLGSPLTAHEWLVPYGGQAEGSAAALAVVNPSADQERRVRVEAVAAGSAEPVAGLDDVVVPAGGRVLLEPAELDDPGSTSLRVVADGPVAVARTQAFADDDGVATAPALALAGTVAPAVPPALEATTDPSVALEGIVPDDTGPPVDDTGPPVDDTTPPTEAPPTSDDGAPVDGGPTDEGEGGDGASEPPVEGEGASGAAPGRPEGGGADEAAGPGPSAGREEEGEGAAWPVS